MSLPSACQQNYCTELNVQVYVICSWSALVESLISFFHFFSPLTPLAQVIFKTPVNIAKNPKINQWLSLVEKEMRMNLATLLAQAVDGISKFNTETIDSSQYMEWVDQYQAQLVVLASQISWSSAVEEALLALQNQSGPQDFAPLQSVLKIVQCTLTVLADSVLQEQPPVRRKKLEHLVCALYEYSSYVACSISMTMLFLGRLNLSV